MALLNGGGSEGSGRGRPFSPWWRRLAGALLVFNGATIALYGPVLPLPQWPVQVPLLGGVSVVPLVLGAAIMVVGVGVFQRWGWARLAGILVAAGYLVLDLVVIAASGSIAPLLDASVDALVIFALARRWPAAQLTRGSAAPA